MARAAAEWQQGDYTLSMTFFPVVDDMDGGEPVVDGDPVIGVAVVTQTCDIVNCSPGKECVAVCPLIEVTPASLDAVRKGRTPGAAILEHPPGPNIVVDLGRMVSLRKSVLGKLSRVDGFSTDAGRMKFAESLERKFGRFAFPDAFNDNILAKLRDRVLTAHGKAESSHGKAYRSINTVRVTAAPAWNAPGEKTVVFHFVLEPGEREATRHDITKTLDEHFKRLVWPEGFVSAEPGYYLITAEDMNVSEWLLSQPIDWDFLSFAGKSA